MMSTGWEGSLTSDNSLTNQVTVWSCGNDDDDDDDDRFIKCITQNASTALRVPVRCEEISLQHWSKEPELSDRLWRWSGERFQALGPATEKARRPNLLQQCRGTCNCWRLGHQRRGNCTAHICNQYWDGHILSWCVNHPLSGTHHLILSGIRIGVEMLSGSEVKAGVAHCTCGWQVKLCDSLLTNAIHERLTRSPLYIKWYTGCTSTFYFNTHGFTWHQQKLTVMGSLWRHSSQSII